MSARVPGAAHVDATDSVGVTDAYRQFLEAKVAIAPKLGFDVDPASMNPGLRPHCRVLVPWMLQGGRRALFTAFGLHKSAMQLEAVRIASEHVNGRGLIVCPLGVRQEFMRDAVTHLHWPEPPKFIRRIEEAGDTGVYLTNYETVRDGKLDPRLFQAASLDEASVLRGFGGTKTFREFMALFAGDDRRDKSQRKVGDGIRFRFVATATPSPNDYIELLAYAAFLGIMDVPAAKTRFFKRNSEKADALTLHAHKEAEFWSWVSTWAVFLQTPSDLGPEFSDEGYTLPPLDVRWHEIPSQSDPGAEKDGQGRMFANAAVSLQDAAREKRDSLPARLAKFTEIINGYDARREECSSARVLPEESSGSPETPEGAGRYEPGITSSQFEGVLRGEPREIAPEAANSEPHELREAYRDIRQTQQGVAGQESRTGINAFEGMASAQSGVSGNVLQGQSREGPEGHSETQAEELRAGSSVVFSDLEKAGRPVSDLLAVSGGTSHAVSGPLACDGRGARNPVPEVQRRAGPTGRQSSKPGAGAGIPEHSTAAQFPQMVVWCDLNDEQRAIERCLRAAGITYSSLYGAQSLEEREQLIDDWRAGRTRVFLSKVSMYGAGLNLQQAHLMVFVGIHPKFHGLIQGVHRVQRFGQTQPVRVDFIYTEAEREISRNIERKWRQHETMVGKMTDIIRKFGLSHQAAIQQLARSLGVERIEASGESYRCINNDCVLEARAMDTDSVDLIVTSIPFGTQYEYSPSYNDMGHTDDAPHFWAQMDFLLPNLLRVLKPGRVAAIHVKDRIQPGGINGFGFQTVEPFSDQTTAAFTRHGFAFLARKTIVTDVVRENNQTYRLGWTEQCKDGSRMGAGMPEYLLIFRKPPTDSSNGYADVPVVKDKAKYTRPRWQFDAHGFTRSSGDRLLRPEELEGLDQAAIFQMFKRHSLENVYDFRHDVKIAEAVDKSGWLPTTFMLLQPQSWHPDIWADVVRMRSLNTMQGSKGKEQHLCPLPFDIVDRCIEQYSMPGETVLDPFGGLMTVPYCAIKAGRRGIGIELAPNYFMDGAAYCAAAEREQSMPSLFDTITDQEKAA